jgi:hypothetical protein
VENSKSLTTVFTIFLLIMYCLHQTDANLIMKLSRIVVLQDKIAKADFKPSDI